MDNKKIVTVAVLAVLALAFAGYGYASYTASTYNEGNEVVVNYLTVEPDSWNAIAAAANPIEVNTYTYGDGEILYKLATGDEDFEKDTAEYVQVGGDYTLKITDETTVDFSSFKIAIDILGQVNTGDDFNLFLKYGDEYEELDTSMEITVDAADSGPTSVTLGLYIKVTYNTEVPFPTTQGWTELLGSNGAPATDALLTGPDETNPTDDNQALATFIFTVTGVE